MLMTFLGWAGGCNAEIAWSLLSCDAACQQAVMTEETKCKAQNDPPDCYLNDNQVNVCRDWYFEFAGTCTGANAQTGCPDKAEGFCAFNEVDANTVDFPAEVQTW